MAGLSAEALAQAGLVNRLNNSFPSCEEGFDSPIPLHKVVRDMRNDYPALNEERSGTNFVYPAHKMREIVINNQI